MSVVPPIRRQATQASLYNDEGKRSTNTMPNGNPVEKQSETNATEKRVKSKEKKKRENAKSRKVILREVEKSEV